MIMNDRIPETQKELAKSVAKGEGTQLPYEVGAEEKLPIHPRTKVSTVS